MIAIAREFVTVGNRNIVVGVAIRRTEKTNRTVRTVTRWIFEQGEEIT